MIFENKSALGIALFLASEAVFFIFLILAYVYLSASSRSGADPSAVLDARTMGLYTLFLIGSSGTLWRAEAASKRNAAAPAWLIATAVLGSVFLFGQGREYERLLARDVTVSRDVFGTAFFTLTGFHGFHVAIGVLLLIVLWTVSLVDRKASRAIQPVALYWHFVDAVWIAIFGVVYVRPLL
jgi:heme/copper-type cytochrome/quinol oxidase subunit 3